jgi:hypothetical protein
MKIAATCLALLSSLLLCTAAPPVRAVEQKTVFNTENIEYKGGTGPERCKEKCSRKSGPDAKTLCSEGWKIVNSTPKEVVAEEYWYVPCSSCEPHGCSCIGTEYTLERDGTAPKAETTMGELDLLKKENEMLKQEISVLRQENEKLKGHIEAQQKTH